MNVIVIVHDQEGSNFHIVNNVKSTEEAEEKVFAKIKELVKPEDDEDFEENYKSDWQIESRECKGDLISINTGSYWYEVNSDNLNLDSDE